LPFGVHGEIDQAAVIAMFQRGLQIYLVRSEKRAEFDRSDFGGAGGVGFFHLDCASTSPLKTPFFQSRFRIYSAIKPCPASSNLTMLRSFRQGDL
jgi:hypothetical protein